MKNVISCEKNIMCVEALEMKNKLIQKYKCWQYFVLWVIFVFIRHVDVMIIILYLNTCIRILYSKRVMTNI